MVADFCALSAKLFKGEKRGSKAKGRGRWRQSRELGVQGAGQRAGMGRPGGQAGREAPEPTSGTPSTPTPVPQPLSWAPLSHLTGPYLSGRTNGALREGGLNPNLRLWDQRLPWQARQQQASPGGSDSALYPSPPPGSPPTCSQDPLASPPPTTTPPWSQTLCTLAPQTLILPVEPPLPVGPGRPGRCGQVWGRCGQV